MVCVMEEWIASKDFQPGDLLFPSLARKELMRNGNTKIKVSPDRMLRGLRSCLGWCPTVTRPLNEYTLKTYRAGKATEMAASGWSLDDIRLAGEWKSKKGPEPYMNMDVADEAQQLAMMVVKTLHKDEPEEMEEAVAGGA